MIDAAKGQPIVPTMKVETAVKRESDGKLFFAPIHAIARADALNDSPKALALAGSGYYAQALAEEPLTDGFVIAGKFYNREETARKMDLGCPSLAETEYISEIFS